MRESTIDAGGKGTPETRAMTPRAALAEMRDRNREESTQLRQQIMQAMLVVCGELGYRKVAVRHVLERYGGHRVQFYSHFAGKPACYAAAYEEQSERLFDEMLAAGAAQPSWAAGLHAALDVLGNFVCEQPTLARGLLLEVHVAGGPALAKRDEMLDRLARALDSARQEANTASYAAPPMTSHFMVSAIEECICSSLLAGDPLQVREAMPEMAGVVIDAYFGGPVAADALALQPA